MLDQIITPQNLDKLSSYYTDQILKILFQQVPGLKQLFDEKKSLYDEAFKIIKSFLSMQVSKKSAHQSANFTKVSAGPRGLPGGGGGGGGRGGGLFGGMATGDKAKAFEKFLGGNWQELVDIVFYTWRWYWKIYCQRSNKICNTKTSKSCRTSVFKFRL